MRTSWEWKWAQGIELLPEEQIAKTFVPAGGDEGALDLSEFGETRPIYS
jgi:hypothetical protein